MGLLIAPDDTIWFAEQYANYIGHYFPATGKYQVYNLPTLTKPDPSDTAKTLTVASAPNDVALDAQGNVWFTESTSDKVARVNVNAVPVTVDEFAVPTAGAQPVGIAAGPDGAMWFAEATGKKIGRIPMNAAPGTVPQEFDFGFGSPGGLVTGPDCNLWVTDQVSPVGRIGKITF